MCEVGGRLVRVLLRQYAGLHQSDGAGVSMLGILEGRRRALRRRVERFALELEQRVALRHAVAHGDANAGHAGGRGRGQLREVTGPRGHGPDRGHHLGEALRRDPCGPDPGAAPAGRRFGGRAFLALPATPRERRHDGEERQRAGHEGSVAVNRRTAPAALLAAATSSM